VCPGNESVRLFLSFGQVSKKRSQFIVLGWRMKKEEAARSTKKPSFTTNLSLGDVVLLTNTQRDDVIDKDMDRLFMLSKSE